ncbi:MAG TPA: phosphoribosylaminoimidazolesuccinocarboxamide synthase [Myxococcota bacterium]|nr:phosphoribosylaminoimidazolesuccinocarboxamide synthase [Myxococcota bacterium]
MGIDPVLLREQCQRTLGRTNFPELGRRIEGKVRDCYVKGDRRYLVASDRVSCFDVVVGTIPFKGQVLNQLAAFWFEKTRDVAPNHVIDVPDPMVTIGRECQPVPIEFVFRGYLTGSTSTSIWRAYEAGERQYCGHRLPDGMKKHQRLPKPLLTPTTKAEQGEHDALTSRDELVARGVISAARYDEAEAMLAKLFAAGQSWATTRGLILVDTKYELGVDAAGHFVLIDEIHTPDSSRYWYADGYEDAFRRGVDPKSLDKEYVRRWLQEQGYHGEGTPPTLPDDVRCEAAQRYIETYERITGRVFEPATDEPNARIRRRLSLV